MVQVVPIQPVPNQSFQAQLGGQACLFNLYQTAYGLFIDVYVGRKLIVAGVICENLNRIVRDSYLGFIGDLAFIDAQATAGAPGLDPVYTGLGSQFQLLYLDPTDIPDGV